MIFFKFTLNLSQFCSSFFFYKFDVSCNPFDSQDLVCAKLHPRSIYGNFMTSLLCAIMATKIIYRAIECSK